MTWVRHRSGPKELPQECADCGVVLIEDRTSPAGARVSEPLEAGLDVYRKDDGSIAVILSYGDQQLAKPCTAPA